MSEKQWFYANGADRKGPYSFEVMVELIEVGRIDKGDSVWREGFDDWVGAGECLDFQTQFASPVTRHPPPLKAETVQVFNNDSETSVSQKSKIANARISTKIAIMSLLSSTAIALVAEEFYSIANVIGFIIGTALGLVAIIFLVVLIPAGMYWLFRRKQMPGFDKTVWGVWAVISLLAIFRSM